MVFFRVGALLALGLAFAWAPWCVAAEQGQDKENQHERDQHEGDQHEDERFPWVLRVGYQTSRVDETTSFLASSPELGGAIDRAQTFAVELGWQVDGSESWHHSYRLPAMGVGVARTAFGNGERLGSPTSIYGWFSWPVVPLGKRATLTTDFGFGAAFQWNERDPSNNPLNDVVTTPVTFYTEVGLYLRYQLTRAVSVYGGGTFSHFSNGGTGDPNGAVNALSSRFGMSVGLGTPRRRPAKTDRARSARLGWELSGSVGGGFKNINLGDGATALTDRRQNFGVTAVGIDVQRRVHSMSALGGGIDLVYDGSAGAHPEHATDIGDTLIGIYGGYEHVIHRFRIPMQLGAYLRQGRRAGSRPGFYQKLGWSFDVTERTFVRFDVRFFDFSKADFVSWTFGIRFTPVRGKPSE